MSYSGPKVLETQPLQLYFFSKIVGIGPLRAFYISIGNLHTKQDLRPEVMSLV